MRTMRCARRTLPWFIDTSELPWVESRYSRTGHGFWIAVGVFIHSLAEADSNLKWSREIARHGLIDHFLCCRMRLARPGLFVQYGD